MKKTFLIKVYRPAGQFLGTLAHASVRPWSRVINDGLGECVIDLAEKFDFSSKLLQLGNVFEIHVQDGTGPGLKVYDGFLSLVERSLGSRESIVLHLLGHQASLAMDVYRSGTTTSMSFASAYVSAILMDIIDKYRTNTPNARIRYDYGETVSPTAEPHLKYLFEEKTYREALDVCAAYAENGEYWRLDPDGRIWFRQPDATPTHQFTFGKHFDSIAVSQSLEKVRSQVLFWNGVPSGTTKVYKKYTDADSNGLYGARVERHFDYGITDIATADKFAARFLADSKDPGVTLTCRISDDSAPAQRIHPSHASRLVGYDIESVNPGDTCRFNGFDETKIDFLTDNMLITKVTYGFDWIDLTIEVKRSGFAPWQKATTEEVGKLSTSGMPTAYTT